MADGNVGCAYADRYKRVECKPRVIQARVAHHDFKGVESGGRVARRRAGRGEVLAAAFLPELEEKGSVWSYKGLEYAVRRSGASWVAGEADAAHWGGEKGVSATNFTVARARLVGALRGERKRVGRWSGFYREWRRRGASTIAGDTGRQAAAWRRGRVRRCTLCGLAEQRRS